MRALVNACLNCIKAYLELEVKKLNFLTLYIVFRKLNWVNFSLILLALLITSLLLTILNNKALAS